MTVVELQALERIEAKLDDHGERLRGVEAELAALRAVDEERVRAASRYGATVRWVVGLAITVTLSLAGLAIAVLIRAAPPGVS